MTSTTNYDNVELLEPPFAHFHTTSSLLFKCTGAMAAKRGSFLTLAVKIWSVIHAEWRGKCKILKAQSSTNAGVLGRLEARELFDLHK